MITNFTAPSIARRLGSSIYEFTLLFGIYFVTGALIQVGFTLLGLPTSTWFLQLVIFVVFGWYFSHSWQKAGQTLAQRTWHIKVVGTSEQLPTAKQAWLRYIAAYLGVLPALLMAFTLIHRNDGSSNLDRSNISEFFVQIILVLLINWLALLGTAWLNPQRRALHEVISGTRSVYISSR
jgi:uncharacterized RDD family membrane protein YckC